MPWWYLFPFATARQRDEASAKAAEPPHQTAPPDALRVVQRAAGNRAIAKAARSRPMSAMPGAMLPEMTAARPAHGARSAGVFAGPPAPAREQRSPFAFAWRGDIFLGDGLNRRGPPARDAALRHRTCILCRRGSAGRSPPRRLRKTGGLTPAYGKARRRRRF